MSNGLAISAVTAAIRNLLMAGVLADPELSDVDVSAVAVAKAPKTESKNQINLFLYQATTNAGWSNLEPPTARSGDTPRPLLALDLHYMLTVYGKSGDELLSHRLLGQAMRVLHDHPVLGRDEVQNALPGSSVGEQIERVRITPEPLSLDEMSKLWSAFQKEYRMSTAYQASVVLIESARGARTPLPVLTRGPTDAGAVVVSEPTPPFPTLARAQPPGSQESARLGELVTLLGHHIDGDSVTALPISRRLTAPLELPGLPGATATEVRVQLPSDPGALPAGLYAVSLLVQRDTDQDRETNSVALSVAPELLSVTPSPAARNAAGDVTLTATCRPDVLPSQTVSLLLGSREVHAQPPPAAPLTFLVKRAPAGQHWLRLRVDGVDSLLVDRSVSPPVFDATQRVTIT